MNPAFTSAPALVTPSRKRNPPCSGRGACTSRPKTLLPSLPCVPGLTRATTLPSVTYPDPARFGSMATSSRMKRFSTTTSTSSRGGRKGRCAFFSTFFSVLMRSSRRRNPCGFGAESRTLRAAAPSRSGTGSGSNSTVSGVPGFGGTPAAATKVTGSVLALASARRPRSIATESMPLLTFFSASREASVSGVMSAPPGSGVIVTRTSMPCSSISRTRLPFTAEGCSARGGACLSRPA